MNYQPIVTIIIPAYNASNFLGEAIDAALAQTYKNIEILVINDGSPDNGKTEEIALSYGDKIKYHKKENGGVSSVLNYAFKIMEGEWFSWLSHDDLYKPQKIEKQIEFLNKLLEENPKIDLNKITVRTATESIDKDGKVIRVPDYKSVLEHEKPLDTILNNVFNYRLSGCAFLLPSACIKDVGNFREDIRTVSDVEYWYRLLFAGYEFYCLKNERLVQNRSHGQQVGKNKVQLFEDELNALHIEIADNLAKLENEDMEYVFSTFYKGLKFRHMSKATKFVKEKYLPLYVKSLKQKIALSISCTTMTIKGSLRNIARTIYRKINVK